MQAGDPVATAYAMCNSGTFTDNSGKVVWCAVHLPDPESLMHAPCQTPASYQLAKLIWWHC